MQKAVYTITPDDLALFTDLYELTMLQSYFDAGLTGEAVFSLFLRRLPEKRNYVLACGLTDVLDYLESVRFSDEAIAYIRSLGGFTEQFLTWLGQFRFDGDVYAVPEGTPVFADEPILEIVAPIAQAQLVETFVMNQIHVQSLHASKAARVVHAAEGRAIIDFGGRRSHGLDAALKAARAFHIAGVTATSNVLAGYRYGLPVAGTMAHSYVEAFDSEREAFWTFARSHPDTILLVDTYDTLAGVDNVITLAEELGPDFRVRAVRLDSGDLGELAKEARRRLDAAGLEDVGIIGSGGLDEYEIAKLVADEAPFTGFGVGTAMAVSEDAPSLDLVYKLCAYGGVGRVKLSPGKPIYPGRKQVFRREADGTAKSDVIARLDEELEGRPLLEPVMRHGARFPGVTKELNAIREHARTEIDRLPARLRNLSPANPPYEVEISGELADYTEIVRSRHR
ncbi:MAG: nicotinate phosphoribosyltransferase [Methyloligellaceae bacterium]